MACGPEQTAPALPLGSGGWGPYRQGQGLVAGASRSALSTGALGRAKNGSQVAGVRVGLDPVWKGDSQLSLSQPRYHGACSQPTC